MGNPKKRSFDPVERAEAELEDAMAEINAIVEGRKIPEQDGDQDDQQQLDAQNDAGSQDDSGSQQADQAQRNDDDENSETYKSRWLSLQGQFKYLQSQMADKDRHIQQLTGDLAQAKAAAAEAVRQAADPGVTSEELESIVAKVTDQYGDDLGKPIDVLTRYIKKLEAELQSRRTPDSEAAAPQQQSQPPSVDPREVYLTQLCPQWQALNYDDSFLGWLNQKAPYSSKTLKAQLNAAYDSGDVEGAAEIFNGYLQAQEQRKGKQDSRAQLQTPASRTSSAQPAEPRKKYWTEREVDDFYMSIQRGTFTGSREDQAVLEGDIHLAYLEGRVR